MAQKLFKVYSSFSEGILGVSTEIEIAISPGLPSFDIIGMCDASIRESRGRIKAAIIAAGFKMPPGHIVVNISPADVHKTGSTFDLPIALGIIFASGQKMINGEMKIYAEGELSLDGTVKACRGGSFRLINIDTDKYNYIIVPIDEFKDLSCANVKGNTVNTLNEAINVIENNIMPLNPGNFAAVERNTVCDFSSLRGQKKASEALIIAASGWHSILMLGSPGSGKTLAGHLLSEILPPLSNWELRYSYALNETSGNITSGEQINSERPFRYVHSTDSLGKLFGSSVNLIPGELALANYGILFADEICEFPAHVLDSLRQPLEEKQVVINRKGKNYVFPADFLFVGAGNPCRCGLYYDSPEKCTCNSRIRKQYRSRLSAPFLDRIDLFTEFRKVDERYLAETLENSDENYGKEIRSRVSACWEIQKERYKWNNRKVFNSNFEGAELPEVFRASEEVLDYCSKAAGLNGYSVRGFNKLLRVGRTIADMKESKDMSKEDISEALTFRYREGE